MKVGQGEKGEICLNQREFAEFFLDILSNLSVMKRQVLLHGLRKKSHQKQIKCVLIYSEYMLDKLSDLHLKFCYNLIKDIQLSQNAGNVV